MKDPFMNYSGRRSTLLLMAGAIASLTALPAWAEGTWPTRTVRIIVPFAPGGGADVSARVLAEQLAPQLGQAVIVENKPGAGSALGVNAAAQAKDGHTLLMGSNSMVINPSFNAAIGYDVPRDFDAVGMVSAQPLVLVVPVVSPIKSVQELVAQYKGKPASLMAGNSGTGTLAHLAAELFEAETGVGLNGRDGREVFFEAVFQVLVIVRSHGVVDCSHEQGVTVCGGLGDQISAEGGASTGLVVHDHWLPYGHRELVGNGAGEHVGCAACRERNHDGDGFSRPGLRAGQTCKSAESGEHNGALEVAEHGLSPRMGLRPF